MLIQIDDRQQAMLLAALLYYQDKMSEDDRRDDPVATNSNDFMALTDNEIDDFCARINTGAIEDPCVAVHVGGGALQSVMSNVPGLIFELHDTDNQEDPGYEREEGDPEGEGPLSNDEQEERWTKLTAGMRPIF